MNNKIYSQNKLHKSFLTQYFFFHQTGHLVLGDYIHQEETQEVTNGGSV